MDGTFVYFTEILNAYWYMLCSTVQYRAMLTGILFKQKNSLFSKEVFNLDPKFFNAYEYLI